MTDIGQQELSLPEQTYMGEIDSGSLKAIKSSTRRSDAFIFLAPDRIQVREGLNVRIRSRTYIERIRTLADSMKVHGFRLDRPLSCFVTKEDGADVVYVADGHTRLEAVGIAIAEGADIPDVPVCLLPRGTSMDDVLAGMHAANTGEKFNMQEQSILAKRLQQRGHSLANIGRQLSVAGQHVENLLILASAPHAIQLLIADEKIASTTVVKMIREMGVEKTVQQIMTELSRQEATGGEVKIRPRQVALPGTLVSPAVRKASGRLYDAIATLKKDPGFAGLSEENRTLVQELIESIAAAEAKSAKKKQGAADQE